MQILLKQVNILCAIHLESMYQKLKKTSTHMIVFELQTVKKERKSLNSI